MCKHFSTMCSLLYSFKFHSYTWILLQFICNMAAAQVLIKKKKKMMPSKLELLVVSWKTWMAQIFFDSFLDVVDILGSSA